MRASTLFALTAAVLIGLGVAVAAKMNGYFTRTVADTPRRADVAVLVAAKNIFSGDMINASDVRLRPLKESERSQFEKYGTEQYLPPVATAAVYRVAKQNIEADTPITRDLLKEFVKPAPLNERLLPDHRAVDVLLPKDRSAGGLIQVGEWVDLYLTSIVGGRSGSETRTAAVAPRVRVIAKRDSLWPVFAPLPKDKPVEYTLEINSYRAALIEFARGKGLMSMTPLPSSEQKKLEAERNERLAKAKNGDAVVEGAAEGQEAASEEMTVMQGGDTGGDHVITDQALVKLFDLKEPTPAPPPALTYIERFSGTRRVGTAAFTFEGKPYFGLENGSNNGNGTDSGVYPPPPYSPNVNKYTGRVLPNNNLYQYGSFQGYNNMNSGNGGQGVSFNFKQPDCPTCNSRKKY